MNTLIWRGKCVGWKEACLVEEDGLIGSPLPQDLNRVPSSLTYTWARSHDADLNRNITVLPRESLQHLRYPSRHIHHVLITRPCSGSLLKYIIHCINIHHPQLVHHFSLYTSHLSPFPFFLQRMGGKYYCQRATVSSIWTPWGCVTPTYKTSSWLPSTRWATLSGAAGDWRTKLEPWPGSSCMTTGTIMRRGTQDTLFSVFIALFCDQ